MTHSPNDAPQGAVADYRKTFDTPVSRFISTMWGGHWHLGVFEEPDEPLLDAQMRANRIMAEAADLQPGQEVLEVACGVGGTARFLARDYGVRVVATNIAQAQLDEAAEITAAEGLSGSVTFRIADFHNLPFGAGEFDCWWCQEAFLYATDKRHVLEQALRVVRPGGSVILSDLTLSPTLPRHERDEFQTAMKTNLWSIAELDALIEAMGLRLIDRRDWSKHAAPTYERLLASLNRIAEEGRAMIGAEAVDNTLFRVRRQYELARDGHLGWIFYAIRR